MTIEIPEPKEFKETEQIYKGLIDVGFDYFDAKYYMLGQMPECKSSDIEKITREYGKK